jgi:antitoxin VapB
MGAGVVGLNIKSAEVHQLARQVADLTGTSMTSAIEIALREKLERLDREGGVEAIVERALRIARESGPPGPDESSDHSSLYDEQGLPA